MKYKSQIKPLKSKDNLLLNMKNEDIVYYVSPDLMDIYKAVIQPCLCSICNMFSGKLIQYDYEGQTIYRHTYNLFKDLNTARKQCLFLMQNQILLNKQTIKYFEQYIQEIKRKQSSNRLISAKMHALESLLEDNSI